MTLLMLKKMCLAVLFLIVVLLDRRSLGCSPVNTATVAGQPVSMCYGMQSGDGLIQWRFQTIGSHEFNVLFNGYNISKDRPRHFISGLKRGEFNLANNDSRLEDAGTYQCIQTIVDQRSYRRKIGIAQLTVFASDPKCGRNVSSQSVVEGDRVQMWCSVDYLGNLDPVMEWSKNNGSTVDSNVSNINSQDPFTLITTVSEIMKAKDHNETYICKTYFKTPALVPESSDTSTAVNAPDYRNECKLTINVLFGPRNLSISPRKNSYIKGERLRCSGSGNPSPTYSWKEFDTGDVVVGPLLMVDKTMEQRKANTYQCTAENIIAGEQKTTSETITINVAATIWDSSSGMSLIVIVGTGAAVGGIAVIVIGVILWRLAKRKCRNQPKKIESIQRRDSPHDYESVNPGHRNEGPVND